MSDFRTPLSRVRGLGSAREGTEHFWQQRLTALANVPLTLFFVGLIVALHGKDYDAVRAALSSPAVALVLLGLVVSMSWHMKLGLQTVIEDYIHGEPQLKLALAANTFFSFGIGLVSAFAILKLAFAG